MKILFVCRGNTGRSQIAAELYNKSNKNHDAQSAGTLVQASEKLVEKIPEATNVIEVMQELGINIAKNTRRQIQEEDLADYTKIIVMAEPTTIPDWLANSEKFTYWKIEDPEEMDLDGTRKIRDLIKSHIDKLTA